MNEKEYYMIKVKDSFTTCEHKSISEKNYSNKARNRFQLLL